MAEQKKRRDKNGINGGVYQRGKKWGYVLDIGHDPLTGKRKQQTKGGFTTEGDAWDALVEANTALKTKKFVKPSKRTVAEFFAEWFPAVKLSLKTTTFGNYQNYANAYVLPIIGNRQLQQIETDTITKLWSYLAEKGRVKGDSNQRMYEHWKKVTEAGQKVALAELAEAGGVTYSAASKAAARYRAGRIPKEYSSSLDNTTIQSVRIMLHRAFEDAVAWQYMEANPVSDAVRVRRTHKVHSTWTPEQLKAFLAEARRERLYAMWLMFATTGVRRGEAAGAMRHLLVPARKIITVWDTRVVANGKVVDSDGKSKNSRRHLALDKRTIAELANHTAMLDQERKDHGADYEDNGLLFCWPDGSPIYPETISDQFDRLVDRAGVPIITLHDVRHTYATMSLRAGVNPKIVSARLGHASVSFTLDMYTEDVPELHHAAAETVSDLFLEPDEDDETADPPIDLP
ncbi:tyrosine-type recombinase/integrase [Sciscionella sediminilitoris]|uniref:tyrosine-type recombinase/integrase n=1 Tax=Sciscionella sediminilitoris TaxID=1445613 RepID=UPI00068AB277|nr:tyrosine-type recombinase/integrase [Sciscionella sp. SE31]